MVHRLVQAVTRDRLAEAERQTWAVVAVRVVVAAYPDDSYNPRDIRIWARCETLLGHALITADYAEELAVALEPTGELLSKVGGYFLSQGRNEEAEPLLKRALHILANMCRAQITLMSQST